MANQPRKSEGDVVLIVEAGTDAGCQLARDLLAAGRRVAVTDRFPAQLTRIMHGYNPSQVLAIAADTSDTRQVMRLIDRVERRFGRIGCVIRAGGSAIGADNPPHRRSLRVAPADTRNAEQYNLAS